MPRKSVPDIPIFFNFSKKVFLFFSKINRLRKAQRDDGQNKVNKEIENCRSLVGDVLKRSKCYAFYQPSTYYSSSLARKPPDLVFVTLIHSVMLNNILGYYCYFKLKGFQRKESVKNLLFGLDCDGSVIR